MPRLPNSSKVPINQNYFQGGITVDPKLGIANSFYNSTNLDFRSKPSQMTPLPASGRLTTNVSDLITAIDQDLSGVRWAVGDQGWLYKINTSNVVTAVTQLPENGSTGLLYNQVTDQLYIPGQTAVSIYGQVTTGNPGQPKLRTNQFAQSASVAPGCVNLFSTPAQVNGGSGAGFFDGSARNNSQGIGVGITSVTQVATNATQTYKVPTALSENIGSYCYFAPDIEPFYSIAVYIATTGTGNWTLTLHDSMNNQLAAVTVTHANLTSGAYNEFKFSSPVRALVNASQTGTTATYHFHLTSTVADGTAGVLTAPDLSTCDFLLFANRLVTTQNGWHPTALFTGSGSPLLCIGNGNYLSTYNFGNDSNPLNTQWVRHQLFFKPGFEVCGLATNNQYLVIAAERRSNNATRNFQDGQLYFWDGTTNAPNFVIDIPMGAPYGLYTFNNVTYFTVAGSLFAWSGGQSVIKVRKLAYQNTDYLNATDTSYTYPNAFTSRYNLLLMGYPGFSTNTVATYGVWSWGTVELTFPNSLAISYTLSHGLTANNTGGITNLKIGCSENFVDSLYTSWQYTQSGKTTYGLDLVDNTSSAALAGTWQSLIYDGGIRYKQKVATRLKVSFGGALPAGCTVTPYYILDRGNKVSGTAVTTGATSAMQEINLRFHEIQYGFDWTCPAGLYTPPIFNGVTLEVDPSEDESQLMSDG